MNICLTDQGRRFSKHLKALKQKNGMPYNHLELREKITRFSLETNVDLEKLNTDFLFGYHLFPGHILNGFPEWKAENRSIRIGDTIVQQAHLPPLRRLSVKMIFGVRICAVINEPARIGFSYETLEGHAERGISTFLLEQADGQIVFSIHTFSKPGNLLTRLVGAIFTVPYQAYCTRVAGRHVIRQLKSQLPVSI
jgi:hypothetical protein